MIYYRTCFLCEATWLYNFGVETISYKLVNIVLILYSSVHFQQMYVEIPGEYGMRVFL